ncbi:MAG TPA: hypothetical protein VGK81_10480, partial [Anaerolineae bacterium]
SDFETGSFSFQLVHSYSLPASLMMGLALDTRIVKWSQAFEVIVVVVGKLALAQHAPLPRRNLGNHIRQDAQAVIGRHDGQANHVPYNRKHKEAFNAASHLKSVFREFLAKHAE